MRDIKELTQKQLKSILTKEGFPGFSSSQIFNWVYKKRTEEFSLMTDLSIKLRDFLSKNFYFSKLDIKERNVSGDKTEKFLFKLKDNSLIETVLIPKQKRNTLCVSTQVGCKFKCAFCASGLSGFKRNLTVSEIINQFLCVLDLIAPRKITNVVFMGVGEPLDNFSNLIKTLDILMDNKGIYLGKRKICVSTVGLIPNIRRFTELNLGVRLSVSLHSADNQVRTQIVPANNKYSLAELIKALREFVNKQKFPITFEYILVKDLNCHKEDALALARLAKSIDCKINLIPYNPSSYFKWQAPPDKEIEEFCKILKDKKVFFTLRKSRGQDIQASCGQLRSGSFLNSL